MYQFSYPFAQDEGDMSTAGYVSGEYATDFGNLSLYYIDSKLMGYYGNQKDVLSGNLSGNVFEGNWFNTTVTSPPFFNWGRFKFVFYENNKLLKFQGVWGYRDKIDYSNKWDGTLITWLFDGEYTTDFGKMNLYRCNTNEVCGYYPSGSLQGKINGVNVVEGKWYSNTPTPDHPDGGSFKFVFYPENKTLKIRGIWGYENNIDKVWNGEKVKDI